MQSPTLCLTIGFFTTPGPLGLESIHPAPKGPLVLVRDLDVALIDHWLDLMAAHRGEPSGAPCTVPVHALPHYDELPGLTEAQLGLLYDDRHMRHTPVLLSWPFPVDYVPEVTVVTTSLWVFGMSGIAVRFAVENQKPIYQTIPVTPEWLREHRPALA